MAIFNSYVKLPEGMFVALVTPQQQLATTDVSPIKPS